MKKIETVVEFFQETFQNKTLIWRLAKNDLKARFVTSMLGAVWAFVLPLVTLLVMWYVFQIGFRNPPVEDVPFIMWLAPAYLSWIFFTEALASGTNCLMEYSYLVRKVNFCVSRIPVVKIISSALVHMGFIVFLFVMAFVFDISFSLYNLQIFYYFGCMLVLLLGLNWMLSAMAPFVKDIVNVVNVVIQIGFWATPIFWSPLGMSESVQNILMINPMYYICQGYRDSLIGNVWFWERGAINFIFWGIALVALLTGSYLFKKLRPQFADVL